jgi:protein ImuB
MVSQHRMGSGATRMSTLYACVHAVEFPAQALLRLRPDLQNGAVVVLEGRPPHELVCAMNTHAFRLGATLGMTRLDAESIPGLRLLARSVETEATARTVLLEYAAKFSPRIQEVCASTACGFVLDIAGTERLFGAPARLAERMRTELASAGFRVSVAVSRNYDAACMKAAASRGVSIIAEGAEAVALAKLPIAALHLEMEHLETFAIWGLRTLGELAALPEVELITRLGQQARVWREAALGELPHMFQPIEQEFALREFCAFETPVEEVDSLLFMGARMIDSLVARAADRSLALALITVRMRLEGELVHQRVLRPAIPSSDRKFLLKLLQLEIAAHPPQAAVIALELSAEAGHCSTVQLGLFTPQTPEPSRLDVTLARIKAMVGEDRVGAPMLEDTHRPGSFRMGTLAIEGTVGDEPITRRIVLRRMRPPVRIRVALREYQPAAFRDGVSLFEITAAYGPWRTSGCWWATGDWNLEEWDVLAERSDGSSIACLLVCDPGRKEWQLEAVYD